MTKIQTVLLVDFAILLVVASGFGCEEGPIDVPLYQSIWPFKVGNSWTYVYEYLDFGLRDTVGIEITDQFNLSQDANTVWRVSEFAFGIDRPVYEWLRAETSSGVEMRGGVSDSDTLIYRTLEFKYPAEVGHVWNVIRPAYSYSTGRFYYRDTVEMRLTSKEEMLETPAGSFRCYVYQFSRKPAEDVFDTWDYRYYFVEEVGMVGYMAVSQSDGTIKEKSLLMSLRLE